MGRGAHVGWGGAMSPHPYRQPPPGLCGPLFSKRWTSQVGLAGDAQLLRRLRPLAGPPRARSGAVGTTPRAGGAVRASTAGRAPRGSRLATTRQGTALAWKGIEKAHRVGTYKLCFYGKHRKAK